MIVFAVLILRRMKSHDPQTCSKFNMFQVSLLYPLALRYVVRIYHNKIINYDITPKFLLAPRKLPMGSTSHLPQFLDRIRDECIKHQHKETSCKRLIQLKKRQETPR